MNHPQVASVVRLLMSCTGHQLLGSGVGKLPRLIRVTHESSDNISSVRRAHAAVTNMMGSARKPRMRNGMQ